jgi:hypothetical protein
MSFVAGLDLGVDPLLEEAVLDRRVRRGGIDGEIDRFLHRRARSLRHQTPRGRKD